LPVQRLAGCCDGKSGSESSGAKLGGSSAWRKDSTDSDVFDEIGIDLRALEEGLEGAVEEVGCLRVFEAAFAALSDWGAEGACYDDLWKTLSAWSHSRIRRRIATERATRGSPAHSRHQVALTSSPFFSNKLALPFFFPKPVLVLDPTPPFI